MSNKVLKLLFDFDLFVHISFNLVIQFIYVFLILFHVTKDDVDQRVIVCEG